VGSILAVFSVFTAGLTYTAEKMTEPETPPPIVLVLDSRHAKAEAPHLEEAVETAVPNRQEPSNSAATRSTCETAIRIEYALTNIATVSNRSFRRSGPDLIYVYSVELSGRGSQGNSTQLSYTVECRITSDGRLHLRRIG